MLELCFNQANALLIEYIFLHHLIGEFNYLTCSINVYFQDGKRTDFGFLFDIDGVIVRGKKLLPSAKDAFDLLVDDKGKFKVPVLFVTNAGNTLRQNKAKDLSDWLGVEVSTSPLVPLTVFLKFSMLIKVILYSYLILKKMNEPITDS